MILGNRNPLASRRVSALGRLGSGAYFGSTAIMGNQSTLRNKAKQKPRRVDLNAPRGVNPLAQFVPGMQKPARNIPGIVPTFPGRAIKGNIQSKFSPMGRFSRGM